MIAASLLLSALISSVEPVPGVPSDLPPEARADNERGIADIEAGAYARGVEGLERSYALMPDPLRHRVGRSKVLGSIRSALDHLHTMTGDPAYLRRLQRLILRHLEALLAALGDAATPEDSEPYLLALWELEDTLAHAPAVPSPPPETPLPTAAPRRPVPPSVAVPATARPTHDVRPAPATGLRRASAVLYGVGGAGLGVMIYGIVVHADSRRRLRALYASVEGSGDPRSRAQELAAADQLARGQNHRTLAVVAGVVGAAALVTGAVLHGLARRRARPPALLGLTPTLTPNFAGLAWHTRF